MQKNNMKNWIKANPNTKIYASSANNTSGFNIYLSISGQQIYIMTHRHNAFLFDLLKESVSVSTLRRWETNPPKMRSSRKYNKKRKSSINHLIKVIDEYINEEIICDSYCEAA